MSSIQYILTDIEGTTTSVSFVVDTLFPYFMEEVKAYVAQHPQDRGVQEVLTSVKKTVLEEDGKQLDDAEAVQQLIAWTQSDRKHPALKTLQGLVWKSAYLEGKIKGHIYPEVPEILK
ncbi:MAG: acireductone synthase, partial [Bacteroidota bacterium]